MLTALDSAAQKVWSRGWRCCFGTERVARTHVRCYENIRELIVFRSLWVIVLAGLKNPRDFTHGLGILKAFLREGEKTRTFERAVLSYERTERAGRCRLMA